MDAVVKSTQSASSQGGPPFLRVRDLFKHFGKFTALKNISLDVHKGEFVCFLGPSGCGKTTLLRAIAGLDPQDEGMIEIGGRDVSHLPPAARDFGIVFQSYALFPNLTVAANVGYGLVNRRAGRAAIDTRVAELLALVGLTEQGAKYPVQLSGGQQQRVALARALATSPGLLLLDEPLSALDARVRLRLRDEVKALQRRLGVTTIMVTHDQEEALAMADRIVVMNHGVIEQIGAPLDIYRAPASPFVADFIGVMNFVAGAMVRDGVVRLGRIELGCEADGFAPGTPVTLAIRPEDIVVQDVRGGEPNTLEARVGAMVFLGSFFRAELVDGSLGDARLRADLSVDVVRRLGIAENQIVPFRLPKDRIRIYPEGTAHR